MVLDFVLGSYVPWRDGVSGQGWVRGMVSDFVLGSYVPSFETKNEVSDAGGGTPRSLALRPRFVTNRCHTPLPGRRGVLCIARGRIWSNSTGEDAAVARSAPSFRRL